MQRKCGTCKFFEEGGIASSGWCRHPERQDLEHMVLVRKSELACRDGWDHDLWEPRESGDRVGTSKRPSSRDVSPGGAHGTNGSSPKPPLRDQDTQIEDGSFPRLTPAGKNGGMNGSASSESSSRNRGLAPEGAQDGVDELQDETIVYHSAAFRKERPTPESDTSQSERAEAGAAVLERHSPVRVVWPERPEHTEREPESAATAVSERQPSPPVQQSGATEQFEVEPAEPATFGVPGVEEPTEEDEANEASDDAADGSSLQLPMLEASNARCRNCRDFIPAKNGSGGFCDNPFAFEQRQSVSGETVACQSSFGSWWSPSDDWWMERADIAHHSAPTPLVNNLIRQIRSRYLEDEGSTEGQERS